VLRASHTRDERLIAFRGPDGPFRSLPAFARLAREVDAGLAGVVRIVAVPGRRGGGRVQSVLGRDWITDEILGTSFRVPAATFLQVHPAAAGTLARHVLDGAGSPRVVVELYGGVGGLGLAFARNGARVTIVEADPDAVACGREAAERAGVPNARFLRADVLRFLVGAEARDASDLVIADPPRTGFGRNVAAALAAAGPRRIVVVSCDPATMARDVAALVRLGYTVDRVVPFDLFPQTAHVETVAWLSRTPPGSARS
jgi:23S rRNA (uracil1939-C5)-methyltransferase